MIYKLSNVTLYAGSSFGEKVVANELLSPRTLVEFLCNFNYKTYMNNSQFNEDMPRVICVTVHRSIVRLKSEIMFLH